MWHRGSFQAAYGHAVTGVRSKACVKHMPITGTAIHVPCNGSVALLLTPALMQLPVARLKVCMADSPKNQESKGSTVCRVSSV